MMRLLLQEEAFFLYMKNCSKSMNLMKIDKGSLFFANLV